MGTVAVVPVEPVLCHLPDLLQGLEHVTVQHLGAVGLVESLDIGVLRGASWLDVIEGNALGSGPFGQGPGL